MEFKMKYTVYETKNKVNGKIYVGVHKTNDVNDSYLGSGPYLLNAIEKYGKENFEKIILHSYDNSDDAYNKEKEIVNEEFVKREDTYNLTIGGKGGWYHVDSSGENNPMKNPDVAKHIAKRVAEWIKDNPEKHRAKCVLGGLTNIGRKDSNEVKAKRAKSVSDTIRSRRKKYTLISPNGDVFKYATISECCEYHGLNRNLLGSWVNTGIITKKQRTTRFSDSAEMTYGWELIRDDN